MKDIIKCKFRDKIKCKIKTNNKLAIKNNMKLIELKVVSDDFQVNHHFIALLS